jgi:hypothetical protein
LNKLLFYKISCVLGLVIGLPLLGIALHLWLGALIYTPIGFLFGIGEASSYPTMGQSLTNLWWHIAPGLAGFVVSLVTLIIGAILTIGGLKLWQCSKVSHL